MVADFVGTAGLHFLPEDRVAVDRALVSGRMLVETRESARTRAVGAAGRAADRSAEVTVG